MLLTLWLRNASTKPTPVLIFGDLNVVMLDELAPNELTTSPELLYCDELFLDVCPIVYPESSPCVL